MAVKVALKVVEVIFKPVMVNLPFNPACRAKADDVRPLTRQMPNTIQPQAPARSFFTIDLIAAYARIDWAIGQFDTLK